ncbi:hypothetical protein KSP35_13150 [Aquihabitans sp. G128]|uniref:hypothetical protein n=1 Tax=Aquihabitans sp. G128 TaxID=2849779 RepID=UPI001C24D8C4|nr:hypothetical protein [Aquihabitans sp. G128]QXC59350.1 hypothetical protein KSP35_13150 [Aquihabitans sp. G128]
MTPQEATDALLGALVLAAQDDHQGAAAALDSCITTGPEQFSTMVALGRLIAMQADPDLAAQPGPFMVEVDNPTDPSMPVPEHMQLAAAVMAAAGNKDQDGIFQMFVKADADVLASALVDLFGMATAIIRRELAA